MMKKLKIILTPEWGEFQQMETVNEMQVEMDILIFCVLPSSAMSALYGVQYIVINR